jgi:hypothetical protein
LVILIFFHSSCFFAKKKWSKSLINIISSKLIIAYFFFSSVVNNSSGVTIIKVENGTGAKQTPQPQQPPTSHSHLNHLAEKESALSALPLVPSMGRLVPSGRPRLGDSRSTGRLSSALHMNRSMTKLNAGHGSRMGLHRSVTRLSSSQHINLAPMPQVQQLVPPPSISLPNKSVTAIAAHTTNMPRFISNSRISSGGVTVTTTSGTVSPTKSIR